MKKFNIVIAGCGGMANTWVRYIAAREDCEIIGMCDIISEKAVQMAAQYGLTCKTFPDITKLKEECPSVNLVVDCTTPDAHELIVTTAMENGCDVIGEKPMAENRIQALNEIAVSERTGKSYSVMQNRIYLPGMRTIRKALSEKKIGEGYTIFSDFFIGAHFGGFRDFMDNPLILDMAVHTFYQARFLMNANPVSVYCQEFNPKGSWYKGNASAVAIFEFENGGLYEYRGSWCSEGHNTTWECDWRIIGSKGTLKWDGANKPVIQTVNEKDSGFTRSANTCELDFEYHFKNVGHEGCFDEMFSALIEGRPAETDCRENFYAMNMVYGAIESAKCGMKILY